MIDTTEPAAEWVAPGDLVPWDRNPRKNDGRPVDAVIESIRRFGFGAPIVARRENRRVIAGHTRLKASLSLRLERVPVRYLDVTEEQADRLALADNRVGELASWDHDALIALLGELDTSALGWSDDALANLLSPPSCETDARLLDPLWSVMVEGLSETEQTALIGRLKGEGYKCRPLML